ncbi:N-acyl homoserine lactonase family protein [Taklimakanibacter deserti]|uniref:N-acyl homoserine lactonase family protein n=1 Tax=Taklimakanibacter deserti TaxID=2267839 RepID=UPI0034D6EE2A
MVTAVERIYDLDGGIAEVADASIYSPGIDVGKPLSLSCNAYLIRRAGQWILWDTGTGDELVTMPGGKIIAHGIRGVVTRTLMSQLAEIGVDPGDVSLLMLSHAHFDHVGNTRLFPKAKWIVQRKEYEAMFGPDFEEYGFSPELYKTLRDNPTEIVEGDHDVFGDGSIRLISTPGHTPGHSSLGVRLPKSGTIILSGDVAHFESNFVHRRVPEFNFDAGQTRASMDKIDGIIRSEGAQLWINHDTVQCATIPHAPQWVE